MPREYAIDDMKAIAARVKELQRERAEETKCRCEWSADGTTLDKSKCPRHKNEATTIKVKVT